MVAQSETTQPRKRAPEIQQLMLLMSYRRLIVPSSRFGEAQLTAAVKALLLRGDSAHAAIGAA